PLARWGAIFPDVAVLPVLPPAGFIGLDHWTGTDALAQGVVGCLPVRRDLSQQIADLTHREVDPMYAGEPRLDDPQRGAYHQAQMLHQTGNAHADTALAQHLPRQVQWALPPGMAKRTPAFEDVMLPDLDGWRKRHVHHLPTAGQMDPTQPPLARRTALQSMFDHLGRGLQATGVVLFGGTLFPRLLGPLGHIGLDKS